MAFTETLGSRKVLSGANPVTITLAGSVVAGDPLGYNSGWVLSASATTIQPLLIAGVGADSGTKIRAYSAAVIHVVTTVTNAATAGAKVALTDAGLYTAAGAGLPDVGYVASVDSDTLGAVIVVCPMIAQVTVVRS